MSSLTRLLLTEAHRTKIQESGTQKKTPLTLRVQVNPDIENVAVTSTKGEVTFSTTHPKIGVLTNFFFLGIENEDEYFVNIIDSIFVHGYEHAWGNIALVNEITSQDIKDVFDFFVTHELHTYQVFCSLEGYDYLVTQNLMNHPEGNSKIEDMPDKSILDVWEQDYFCKGILDRRPVHVNEHLGPYVVFATSPSLVGVLTRIGDHVSLCLHNVERGLVILRLNDGVLSSGIGSES